MRRDADRKGKKGKKGGKARGRERKGKANINQRDLTLRGSKAGAGALKLMVPFLCSTHAIYLLFTSNLICFLFPLDQIT